MHRDDLHFYLFLDKRLSLFNYKTHYKDNAKIFELVSIPLKSQTKDWYIKEGQLSSKSSLSNWNLSLVKMSAHVFVQSSTWVLELFQMLIENPWIQCPKASWITLPCTCMVWISFIRPNWKNKSHSSWGRHIILCPIFGLYMQRLLLF